MVSLKSITNNKPGIVTKIKVAHLIGALNRGGAQRIVLDTLSNIDKSKFEPYLIFWRKTENGFYDEFAEIEGLNIIQLKNRFEANTIINKINLFIKQKREIYDICKDNEIDILHSHLFFNDIYAILTKRKIKNLKIISSRHNSRRNIKKYKIINSYIDKKFNKIIAVSNSVKKDIMKFESLKNIMVIYNAVDLDLINNIQPKKYDFLREINIISVGRLVKQKGFERLIEVFKIFNKAFPNSRLLICGEGKDGKKLEDYVHTNKMDNNILLLGNRKDVYSLMKSSDLFVLLSRSEAFGIVFIEAMACGLPVMGGNVDGIKEIIKDNGYLVDVDETPESYMKTAEIMINLIKNKELMERMKNRSLKLVKEFDIKNTIKKYEGLLNDLSKI